jgi:hypothetical protein
MTIGRAPFRDGAVRFVLATVVVFFCTAPTPGDIGGCGQRVQPLGAEPFFESKKDIDCEKCRDCDFTTDYCTDACDTEGEVPSDFPEGCDPIVHDGEVCLNALDATGCGEYESYVRDENRQAPNECRFCPWEDTP